MSRGRLVLNKFSTMEPYNRILILENDIESQGLPDILDDVIAIEKLPHDVWWWFKYDIKQNPQEGFKRFAKVSKDTLIVSYPSFVGWDNTFEGNLFLFTKLKEAGIKIRISICYYPDFYLFVLKWLHDLRSDERPKKSIDMLKSVLKYHEIYYFRSEEIWDDKKLSECSIRLTWKSLEDNYFGNKKKFKVNSTGEILEIGWIHIDRDSIHKSYINPSRDNTISSDDRIFFPNLNKL